MTEASGLTGYSRAIDEILCANALKVLEKRYLKKDEDGEAIEKPSDMFVRVAENIAEAERAWGADDARVAEVTSDFYELMTSLEFLPNSPTLMNAGRDLQQLSACFVLPVEDSMESIFGAVRDTALIHKSGGGTGFSFSRLRPGGDQVRSTQGVSSGPVSFMRVFNQATEAVKQGGTRRGANMGVLRIDHPDILHFIKCKADGDFANFNISVALTEKFMEGVKAGTTYELVNPRSKEPAGELDAREVWDLIIEMAWATGDPGIIFIDRINRDNPTPQLGEIESTNPCGEQPLLPYEACNLGSVNLSKFVRPTESGPDVDWDHLADVVHRGVRFLGRRHRGQQLPASADRRAGARQPQDRSGRHGLGRHAHQDEPRLRQRRRRRVRREGHGVHRRGGQVGLSQARRGAGLVPQLRGLRLRQLPRGLRSATRPSPRSPRPGRCRSSRTARRASSRCSRSPTCAPSWTTIVWWRSTRSSRRSQSSEASTAESSCSSSPTTALLRVSTRCRSDVQAAFVTAHDIAPSWHITMQAAFQKYTDNAVSKTVNFSSEATADDVRSVYDLAYELGVKGVTIYRDGSKQGQVLTTGKSGQAGTTVIEEPPVASRRDRAAPDGHPSPSAVPRRSRPVAATSTSRSTGTKPACARCSLRWASPAVARRRSPRRCLEDDLGVPAGRRGP